MRPSTLDAATGRWREILPALGVPPKFLDGRHQPCPLCGGKDRARYTDLEGNGSYFCNQCGAGTGMQLLMKLHQWDFARAAKEVDAVIGNLPKDKPKLTLKPKPATAAEMNRIWNSGRIIQPDDPVGRYLAKRGLFNIHTMHLQYVPQLRYAENVYYPAMIAKFCDPTGHPRQLHRTFLSAEGDKAPVEQVRKFMPGELPKGGCIRLGAHADVLGIAEGIETALSAAQLFKMPVWAATSETMLQAWEPPQSVKRVAIFADNDANFVGHAAAYALAKRLVLDAQKRGIPREVDVKVPEGSSKDWNDVLQGEHDARATH